MHRRRTALLTALALAGLASCKPKAKESKPVTRPPEVLAEILLPSLSKPENIMKFFGTLTPGADQAMALQLAAFTQKIAADLLEDVEAIDLSQPTRVFWLDQRKYTPPWAILGTPNTAVPAEVSADNIVVQKKGELILVAEAKAVTALSGYTAKLEKEAFSHFSMEVFPSLALQANQDALNQFLAGFSGKDSVTNNSADAAATSLESIIKEIASQVESLRLTLPKGEYVLLEFKPVAQSDFASFSLAQTPDTFSNVDILPALSEPEILVAGHFKPGAFRDQITSLSSWFVNNNEKREPLTKAYQALLSVFDGEAFFLIDLEESGIEVSAKSSAFIAGVTSGEEAKQKVLALGRTLNAEKPIEFTGGTQTVRFKESIENIGNIDVHEQTTTFTYKGTRKLDKSRRKPRTTRVAVVGNRIIVVEDENSPDMRSAVMAAKKEAPGYAPNGTIKSIVDGARENNASFVLAFDLAHFVPHQSPLGGVDIQLTFRQGTANIEFRLQAKEHPDHPGHEHH